MSIDHKILLALLTCLLIAATVLLSYHAKMAVAKGPGIDHVRVILSSGVVTVKDGDTFHFNNQNLDIRLAYIDAPEKAQVCVLPDGVTDFPCAEESRTALMQHLLQGELVCFRTGMSYDRVVMKCYVDGKDIGYDLVRKGYAVHDPQYTKTFPLDMAFLTYAEGAAKLDGIGVRRDPNFETPMSWRKRNKRR